tara:strand:- start:6330 stop:7136 length:807 start_codon:yes stop_codon:yes gene_type:complete
MTFIEFLTKHVIYAYLVILIFVVFFIAYGINYFRHKKSKIPSKEELDELYDSLKKLVKKTKKVEIRQRAEKKIKKQPEEIKIVDSKINPFNITKSKSILSFSRWKGWFFDKYFTGSIILINMELKNGFHRLFTVREKEEGFVFKDQKYIFDDEMKYYNIDAGSGMYAYDYHEALALPLRRKVPITDIKKTIESSSVTDIEYAINPSTLQRFMTAKIAEGVMKGTQLDEFMRKLQMFLIVTMIVVIIHFLLFVYGSGMLQDFKIPGVLG